MSIDVFIASVIIIFYAHFQARTLSFALSLLLTFALLFAACLLRLHLSFAINSAQQQII